MIATVDFQQGEGQGSSARHRLESVENQVEESRFQRFGVDGGEERIVGNVERPFDLGRASGIDFDEPGELFEELSHLDRLGNDFDRAGIMEHGRYELFERLGPVDDQSGHFLEVFLGLQIAVEERSIAPDASERVADFVGDGGRHLSEFFHPVVAIRDQLQPLFFAHVAQTDDQAVIGLRPLVDERRRDLEFFLRIALIEQLMGNAEFQRLFH